MPADHGPLATFALFAYNQERFVREAVDGALCQDYGPLQIIISDDHSADGTFDVIQSCTRDYRGPHRIVLNRNEKNLGIGGHINKLMTMAQGELIVAAAGDDISLPTRVTDTVRYWLDNGRQHCSICSKVLVMNEAGKTVSTLDEIIPVTWDEIPEKATGWLNGMSHAWHRSLFDIFGPLNENVVSEDKAIGFRSLLLNSPIGYINKALVKYRVNSSSITLGSTYAQRLDQKASTWGSYLTDINRLISLNIIDKNAVFTKAHQIFQDRHKNFLLKKSIVYASLPHAIILIVINLKNLSFKQVQNLLICNINKHNISKY